MADHRHRCFSLTLVHLSCSPRHLIAKACLANMQTFRAFTLCLIPRVWPGLFIGLLLVLCRLPTLIQPALLSDYPECSLPALILHRTLTLILLYLRCTWSPWLNSCIFKLHSVLIKLHMDPNATDSSLQLHTMTYSTIIKILTLQSSVKINEIKSFNFKHRLSKTTCLTQNKFLLIALWATREILRE